MGPQLPFTEAKAPGEKCKDVAKQSSGNRPVIIPHELGLLDCLEGMGQNINDSETADSSEKAMLGYKRLCEGYVSEDPI